MFVCSSERERAENWSSRIDSLEFFIMQTVSLGLPLKLDLLNQLAPPWRVTLRVTQKRKSCALLEWTRYFFICIRLLAQMDSSVQFEIYFLRDLFYSHLGNAFWATSYFEYHVVIYWKRWLPLLLNHTVIHCAYLNVFFSFYTFSITDF